MSFKIKNYILIVILAIVFLLLFFYFFGLLDASNQKTASEIQSKQTELASAQAEQKSFLQAQKDLEALKLKTIQPQDFFNNDTHLVKEIQSLEQLSQTIGVDLTLQVSGTAKAAAKLGSASSPVVFIPYTINLSGDFAKVVTFLQSLQHTTFVTQIQSINISALPKGQARAVLSAQFYIKP